MSGVLFHTQVSSFETALREGFFQTVSIMTGTGYTNANWTLWPALLQLILLLLMLTGGMSGSTTGGIKVVRIAIFLKLFLSVKQRLLQPNRIVVPKLGSRNISQEVAEGCVALAVAALCLILATGVTLNLLGMDMGSALSAAVTCVANVGPGLMGTVGPAGDFASVPDIGKLLLSFDMVAGRLEIFTVLMLFSKRFWTT